MNPIIPNMFFSKEHLQLHGLSLGRLVEQVGIPTAYVIESPQMVVPTFARIFVGCLQEHAVWWHEQQWKTSEDLRRTKDFMGTYPFPQMFLVEVWENDGCDGHISYIHEGYRIVLAEQDYIVDVCQKHKRPLMLNSLPACYAEPPLWPEIWPKP